ncbi:MAG TPA: exodeoxyribonuclease VII large subunit [Acidimicrobiales bacterium]
MSIPYESPTYTVAELARRINYALEDAFPDDVWVTGEISGLNRSRGGHVYFDLIEPAPEPGHAPLAAIPVALFKMNKDVVNRLLKRAGITRIDVGMQVRIRGVVTLYERTGRLQLRMTGIDPTYTIGQLAADRDRVLRMLAAEGLADRNSKLPLPLVPLHIGLVTSAGSAAYHDFITELERSGYAWRVQLVDTRVQGHGADVEVERALRCLAARGVDVIALVRGGGSRLDLAAFDSERVARTIATLPVPVLTGVGHEIDRSVADDVAHTAYKTPTACATGLVARVSEYLDNANRALAAVRGAATRLLDRHDQRLRASAQHCARATRAALAVHAVRIDHFTDRLQRDAHHVLDRARSRLDRDQGRLTADAARHLRGADAQIADATARVRARPARVLGAAERHLDALAAQVRALDPARTLARGWSITRTADGRVVRSLHDAPVGAEVITTVADGSLRSTITHHEPADGQD